MHSFSMLVLSCLLPRIGALITKHRLGGLPFEASTDAAVQEQICRRNVGSRGEMDLMAKLMGRRVRCPAEHYGGPPNGRCMPASIFLQLEASNAARELGIAGPEQLRLSVIRYAERNVQAPWTPHVAGQETLGKVIAAATCKSYFHGGLQPGDAWQADFRRWQREMRLNAAEGCDDAWLFAAAMCFPLKIHVYTCTSGIVMKRHTIEAPRDHSRAASPLTDVHLGFVREFNGIDDEHFHCVSLLPAYAGAPQLTPALTAAALLYASSGEGVGVAMEGAKQGLSMLA